MINFINQAKTNIKLFSQTPKDFMYSYTHSKNEKVIQKPHNPKAHKVSQKIIRILEKNCPELSIHFVGSASLGIPGTGDIDLYVTTSPNLFEKVVPSINVLFGKPKKVRKEFTEWEFEKGGIPVELILIDPNSRRFKEQLIIFNALKKDKTLLDEYKNLKKSLNMSPKREYIRKRMEFFNRILKEKSRF